MTVFAVEQNPITESVWAARGPSIWTRKDDEPAAVEPVEEKPKRPVVPGPTHKLIVDVDGIVAMRREGYTWPSIAQKFGCSKNTCRERVQAVAPELMGQGVRGKHWKAGDAA